MEIVLQCFDALKVYGKQPEQINNIVKAFTMVLGDYSIEEVRDAFTEYLCTGTDFPAPADIMNILDPPPEPLSAAVYVGIKKRIANGEYIWRDDELAYLRNYEAQEMRKMHGGTPELRNAKREIEDYTKTLQIEGY